MSKKLIIIKINFNNFTLSDNRFNPDWIDYRMKLFMNYPYKSLIHQTNQNFLCLVQYDPSTKEYIENSLSKYDKLPDNIKFVDHPNLVIGKLLKGYDVLYEVRLDSDDMYHPTYIEQLFNLNIDEDTQVIINQNGYGYDIINDRLGIWYVESPPFFVFVYKPSDFIDGFRYHLKGGHQNAIKLNHLILNESNYMFILHGTNVSNTFLCRFNKQEIVDEDTKNNILKEFNIDKLN